MNICFFHKAKGLAIQGKTKNCTITNMQTKGKKNNTDLQLKEKEETRGSKGVSPLALEKKTCQKLRKIQEKGLAIQGKTKNYMKKKQKRGSKGVS